LFIETSFIVTITASASPIVTAADFIYQTAPQRLTFTFNQDVHASLSTASIRCSG